MKVEYIELGQAYSEAQLKVYWQETPAPMIMICPGGGYISYLEEETESVARFFLGKGYHVSVLYYSLGIVNGKLPIPMIEAAKSIGVFKENAEHWQIKNADIFVLGLSSGGHIASYLATQWDSSSIKNWMKDNQNYCPTGVLLYNALLDLEPFPQRVKEDMAYKILLESTVGTESHEVISQWDVSRHISSNTVPLWVYAEKSNPYINLNTTLKLLSKLEENHISYEAHIEKMNSEYSNSLEMALNWLKNELKL